MSAEDPRASPIKATAWLATAPLAKEVAARFGPLQCNHPAGTHKPLRGVDTFGKYITTAWENYSTKTISIIGECFHAVLNAGNKSTVLVAGVRQGQQVRALHDHETG